MAFRTLIGRSRELADLEMVLARAMAGQGSTFLLSGEPGIGKTRLAEEIAERGQGQGASVFWGRAWEVEGAPACWPWVQVLRACAHTEAGASFVSGDAHGRELAPLLAREPAARTEGDSEFDFLRLGFAIVALLAHLSRKGPLVLVFDDLHASDVASLNLLEVVAREVRGLPVLLVGTYRELEARRTPKVASLLARLAREGTLRPLGPLDRAEVTGWVAAALGAQPAEALAGAVFDATEGNPLFVDALSQLIAARGQGAFSSAGFALPDTIRETVRELLARLSPAGREVLDAVAVLGRECAAPALQWVSGKAAGEVLAAVGEGIAAGVLTEQAAPAHSVRFAHVLIREAIYQELPAARRVTLHASAASALERLPAGEREGHLAELAHHSFESGAWLAAADYASRAGNRAMSLFAVDDAAKHFERALSALERSESTDDGRRADWLWKLGLAQIRLGQSRLGKDACERAAALAMQCGRYETQAAAALAYGSELMYGYIDPRLVALLESALASPLGDEAMRARVMARLAAAMTPTAFPEKPKQLRAEAIRIARASGDRRVLADVLFAVRAAFTPADDLDERVALDRELAMLAVMLDDRLLEVTAHTRLMFDALESADPTTAQVELRIQQQLASEVRSPVHALRAACCQLLWGSLTANEELIARSEHRLRELADVVEEIPALAVLEANRYARAAVRGDDSSAVSALAAGELHTLHDARAAAARPLWRAMRLAHQGNGKEARASMLEFFPEGPRAAFGPVSLAFTTPACIRIGDLNWIRTVYDEMLPYAERNSLSLGPFISLGPYAYHLGCLASVLGWPEKAAEHFRVALAMSERAGFADYVARIRRELDALEGLRPPPASPAAVAVVPELRPHGEYWTLQLEGREVRLRESKGLHFLAALLREPGREFHVADLVGLASAQGDAGELLDARARAAYRERLTHLAAALDDAESRGDREGAIRIRVEREALADELSRAMGLGGRARKSGAVAERARINVQRRIRDVISRVSEVDTAMGRYLERHVKTGVFCSWEP